MDSSKQDMNDKKQYLLKLKQAVAEAQEHVQQLQAKSLSLKEELDKKNEEVCEEEVSLEILKVQGNVIHEQNRELEKENMELENETRSLQKQYVLEIDHFCRLSSTFCNQYKTNGVSPETEASAMNDILGFDLSCILSEQKLGATAPSAVNSIDNSGSEEIFANVDRSNECIDDVTKSVLETSFDMDF